MDEKNVKVGQFIFVMILFFGFAQIGKAQTIQFSNPLVDVRFVERIHTSTSLSNHEFSLQIEKNPFQKKSILPNSSLKNYPSLHEAFSTSKEIPSSFSQPKAYAYCDLAFFCKIEVQMEKAAKVPVKFRLGDVRYVDYLEQKTDSPK